MVRRRLACAVLCAAAVCVPSIAGAQAYRSGDTFSLGGTTVPVEMPDVAFDSVNNQYLQVAGKGFIEAHLLNATGSIIRTVNVTDGAVYAQTPRVAFSPHVAGGGGYLVTWHASLGNFARVRGRILDRSGTALTGEIDIATLALTFATSSDWTKGAPVAAATASAEFLVVWGANRFSTRDIHGQRVGVNGALLGANLLLSGGGADLSDSDPSVGYSPASNKFLVGWGLYSDAGSFGTAAARTVDAGTGAMSVTQNFGMAVAVWITSISYNPTTDQFLLAWDHQTSTGQAHYGILLNSQGSAVSGLKVLSGYYAAYDALDVEFNGLANEFLLVTHGRNQEDAAVSISADGTAFDNGFLVTSTGNVTGNFNPRLAVSTLEKTWLVVTSTQFSRSSAQFVTSGGGGGNPPPPPPPPTLPGHGAAFERAKADFDGDGTSDLLWQNMATGYMSIWEMTSTLGIKKAWFLNNKVNDTNWKAVGTGDFNGDGKPDILFRHSVNGELVVWYLSGPTLIGSDYLSTRQVADMGWKVAGVGDFNADGKPDILWHHDNGTVVVWLMNGVTVSQSGVVSVVGDTRWKIAGVGDFNGDSKSDLIWRHENGWTAVWLMNGTSWAATASFNPPTVDQSWRIAAVIDGNRDGKADIVWQNESGWVAVWLMDGVNRAYTSSLGQVADTSWKIAGSK